MRINYVVTCWSGERRFMEEGYEKDCTHFLKMQLQQLNNIKTSIDQITFVVNHNPDENKDYKTFIDDLPKEINSIPVEVLRRDNSGMMFGVWFHVYETYGDDFDYYFVTEDDYVPVHDNFELFFLNAIKKHENCGFMCPGIRRIQPSFWEKHHGDWPERLKRLDLFSVPTFVVGLISSKCLGTLLEKHGKFLYDEINYEDTDRGLIFWAINSEGFSIDQLESCRTCSLQHKHSNELPHKFCTHGSQDPLIFAPTLYVEQHPHAVGYGRKKSE